MLQEFATCSTAASLLAAAADLTPVLATWTQCAAAAAASANPLDPVLISRVEFMMSYCYEPHPYGCTGDFGAPPLVQCRDFPNYDSYTQ